MARARARPRVVIAGRRPFLRAAATLAFAALLLGTAALGALGYGRDGGPHFSHQYPPNPVKLERPKARGPAPVAPQSNTLSGPQQIGSLAQLAALLPHGVLRPVADRTWLLTQPVALTRGATLAVAGASLEIGPNAFLEARTQGRIALTSSSVSGVDEQGQPLASPVPQRGFLAARDGGKLLLRDDRITDLGHLGVVSYGISFRRPGPGSAVADSTIRGNYFGIFLSHAAGVAITGNRVLDSHVYGIDPYGYSHDVLIARNLVLNSGLHGIILADHVSDTSVVGNVVDGAHAHGIVLFRYSSGNALTGNKIAHTFDGIVLTDSSSNRLSENAVEHVVRFGIRASGRSEHNHLERNSFSAALLGVYLYGGAAHNELIDSIFSKNRENVRVRSDAPHNIVSPVPPLSELG